MKHLRVCVFFQIHDKHAYKYRQSIARCTANRQSFLWGLVHIWLQFMTSPRNEREFTNTRIMFHPNVRLEFWNKKRSLVGTDQVKKKNIAKQQLYQQTSIELRDWRQNTSPDSLITGTCSSAHWLASDTPTCRIHKSRTLTPEGERMWSAGRTSPCQLLYKPRWLSFFGKGHLVIERKKSALTIQRL